MLIRSDKIITSLIPDKLDAFQFRWTFFGEDKNNKTIVAQDVKVDIWPGKTGTSVDIRFYGKPKTLKKLIGDIRLAKTATLKVFDGPNGCLEEWDYDGLSTKKYEVRLKDTQYIMSALVKSAVMIVTFDFYDVYHTDHYRHQMSP